MKEDSNLENKTTLSIKNITNKLNKKYSEIQLVNIISNLTKPSE